MTNWHSEAIHIPYADAGPFVKAAPKIVWHTTQGKSLPTYSGSAPHFTFNPRSGQLWQHIPIDRAAKSLEHPDGTVETNHAHCIQVELIGFAEQAPNWSEADYARIAKLARWIEVHAGVPSQCSVRFTTTPKRLSPAAWLAYAGHLGHQHVPAQTLNHWDPGAFQVDLVLAGGKAGPAPKPSQTHPTVRRGDNGETVHHLQSALRGLGYKIAADSDFGPATERAVKEFQWRHSLTADGVVGPRTWAAIHKAHSGGKR